MPHLLNTINLGEVITLLTFAGGCFLAWGKHTQELRNTREELTRLRADFNTHAEQDMANFRDLHNALLSVATAQKGE